MKFLYFNSFFKIIYNIFKDNKLNGFGVLIVIFIICGLYVVLTFRDHNFKRAIDACIAGSQKLEKPMTVQEAKKFCEDKIMNNN